MISGVTHRLPIAAAFVGAALVFVDGRTTRAAQPTPAANPTTSAEWRAKGLQLGYNLDRAEALEAFRHAAEADPGSPAAHRLLAASAWTAILFEQGAVSVEDYLGNASEAARRQRPNEELAALFAASLDRATALADQALAARRDDRDARYQAGAAYGLRAAYTATVDGKVLGSMGAARRAYREHQSLLGADPDRKDAGLIVGLYKYTVSTLSAPRRLGAYLAGFSGGRDEGLRLVESAAAYAGDAQPQARFTLILLYNRERRYEDALRVIRELQGAYPRNRLLWLEEGSTGLRAGDFERSRVALEAGLARFQRDARRKAPGEEARWRYAYGAALAGVAELAGAKRELTAALPLAIRDWVRGRIHFELGKLADRSGARTQAIAEYREAERLCRLDHDTRCVDDARTLMRKGYRP